MSPELTKPSAYQTTQPRSFDRGFFCSRGAPAQMKKQKDHGKTVSSKFANQLFNRASSGGPNDSKSSWGRPGQCSPARVPPSLLDSFPWARRKLEMLGLDWNPTDTLARVQLRRQAKHKQATLLQWSERASYQDNSNPPDVPHL